VIRSADIPHMTVRELCELAEQVRQDCISCCLAHPQMGEALHLHAIDGLAAREILLDRAIGRAP
jgi:hypothetical protein